MGKIILVTGASAGFGKLATCKLLEQGHTVYAVARRIEKMDDIKALGAKTYKMDVTSDEDVNIVIADIIKNEGRIDVLVNNAGYGGFGMFEAVSLDEARRQFDANVFGLARVTKAVLPHMRRKKSGTIINLSSLVGRVASPMIGWYSASKHAVEAVSDSLRAEVLGFGIKVALIEPGAVATEFLDVSLKQIATVTHPDEYKDNVAGFIKGFKASYAKASGPQNVVKAILKAANSKNPKARYKVGLDCKSVVILSRILPAKTMDILKRMLFRIK